MHTARSLDKIAATQDHLGGNTLQHLTISTRLSCRIDESQQLITVDECDTHDNGIRQALVRHHREVLDLKREEVRRALMLLGWSPPVQVNRREADAPRPHFFLGASTPATPCAAAQWTGP